MKDIFESLINIADRLDKKGYDRQADMVDAVAKTLLSNITTDKIQDQDAPIKVKQEQNKLSKDFNRVRKLIVDDENIKDLFDAKEELTKMKNSREYHLNDNEWSYVYEQILEDKFKRDYEKKSSQNLEEELNKLLETKKRKGELDKLEEFEFKMIDEIYKQKIHEEVRPSDSH